MASLPTVLVFTCAEYGQANVNLATSYELALAGVNVCIASFAGLEPRIQRLQELVIREARSGGKPPGSVYFHECKGIKPYWDGLANHGLNSTTLMHPPGVSGAIECFGWVHGPSFPWTAEEHLTAIKKAEEVIETIKPSVVVVDPLFLPAIDACKLVGQKFVVLTPTSISDLAIRKQPHMAALWKYPVISSGFPFPLKWWQILLNIYLNIRLVINIVLSTHVKKVQAARKSLGITASGGYELYPDVAYITPALPELEWPLAVIPTEIVACGPIIFPFAPVEEADPALARWLDKGPTVMINLGSHVVSDEKLAKEMAGAFRLLLDYHGRRDMGKMQVLWKVKTDENVRTSLNRIIGRELEEGRVRIVGWLEAEPVAILQHPNIVCTVHHGGANSFYEGVWSGVPHIVLPVWLDTYAHATRAEYLNIGVYGNKSCAPGVRAEEFGEALVRVTGDTEEASKFRSNAQRLQMVCRAKGNGRELASALVLREIGTIKEETILEP